MTEQQRPDEDVEGHSRREDAADEVEGHSKRFYQDPEAPEATEASEVSEDVEGHSRRLADGDPGDDVEGHRPRQ